MSNFDVLIVARQTEWAALATAETPFSYAHSNAVTGYWVDPSPYTVYNVIGTQTEIQAIVDALTDVRDVYAWGQGNGFDSLEIWPTDPDALLLLMKPHNVYDAEGNITGTTPATFANPNWGHVFSGQQDTMRIFAGDFSDEFTEEFY